jgi:hypothetical protein
MEKAFSQFPNALDSVQLFYGIGLKSIFGDFYRVSWPVKRDGQVI